MIGKTMMVAALALGAGAAEAQLTFTQNRCNTDIFYSLNDRTVSESMRINLADYPGGYSGSLQAGPEQSSYVQSLEASFTGSLETTDRRFAVQGAASTTGVLTSPQPNYTAGAFNRIIYDITVTQDTTLRFRLAFTGEEQSEIALTEDLVLWLSSANEAFAPFIAGFGDSEVTVPSGFDFTIDVAAGETISLDLRHRAVVNADRPNSVTSWDLASSFDFSVEVVPAPGAAAAFGIAGLAAARRRR